ncbi:hypothetical protein C8J57DRAFT_523138 [Mycena rebaudengoi]|nr:hypothetical protein C8J57DRAFT_523138 [Mycena rebaudengoi]
MTEEMLRDELGRFGLQVKIVRDKGIGFVQFLSVGVATKVVSTLPPGPASVSTMARIAVPKSQGAAGRRAESDDAGRCGPKPIQLAHLRAPGLRPQPRKRAPARASSSSRTASPYTPSASYNPLNGGNGGYTNATANGQGNDNNNGQGNNANGGRRQSPYTPYTPKPFSPDALSAMMNMNMFGMEMAGGGMNPGGLMSPISPGMMIGAMNMNMASLASGAVGNRTVYLGNIHPETSTEDQCNSIRWGVLQSVSYMADKHNASTTFIDPAAAFTFFQVSSYLGLTLNNRCLKIGWGKNSGPLPPTLALAVHAGATCNVYIGNIEDFEVFGEERLKADIGEFGDIELVNFLKEELRVGELNEYLERDQGDRRDQEPPRVREPADRARKGPVCESAEVPQGGSGGRGRGARGNGGPNSAEPQSAIERGDDIDPALLALQDEGEEGRGQGGGEGGWGAPGGGGAGVNACADEAGEAICPSATRLPPQVTHSLSWDTPLLSLSRNRGAQMEHTYFFA